MSDVHVHECECAPDDRCEFCGCCHHCSDVSCTCKVRQSSRGMRCPDVMCGCEGLL